MKVYIILLFCVCIVGPISASTPSYINTDQSSSALQYGTSNKAVLRLDNLTLFDQYILIVANNTNGEYNITWIANSISADVYFNYADTQLDINNNPLTQLELVLVDNTTNIILINYYMPLQYNSSVQGFVEWLSSMAVLFIELLIAIICFVIVIKIVQAIR